MKKYPIQSPMLAGKIEDENIDKLVYPLYATPKLDGIRCMVNDIDDVKEAVTRSFKLIPNRWIREKVKELPLGLDGEIIIQGLSYNDIQSAVMSEDGESNFKYVVFDYYSESEYLVRMDALTRLSLPKWCVKSLPAKIENKEELLVYEEYCLAFGYEGVMVRRGDGKYKFGRSTFKEMLLLKLKKFEDAEAEIIGFEEQMENTNEATQDAFGHTKRSSAKAGMKPKNTLGKFNVRDLKDKTEFDVGTGKDLTEILRQKIWDNKEQYLGRIIVYTYQVYGMKDKPRIPIFKGFRDKRDMD